MRERVKRRESQAKIAIKIAEHCDLAQLQKLDELFIKLDTNESNTIQLIEIKKQLFDIESGEAIIDVLKGADVIEGDGEIQYEEFVLALTDVNIFLNDQNLKSAFDSFDINKDQHIDLEEF